LKDRLGGLFFRHLNVLSLTLLAQTLTLLTNESLNVSETPNPVKRERRKQHRPGELLDAALDLFVEKGFAATRAEEVAAKAGVSKGTLFLYFPSKEELFKAVVRENAVKTVAEGALEVANFKGSAAELLHFLILEWWRRYGATKASGITKLIISEGHHFPDLANFYQEEVIQPAMALLKDVLRRGQESGEFKNFDIDNTAMVVIAPMLFFIMAKFTQDICLPGAPNIPPEHYIAQHADLMVRGLSHEKIL
jgi:TetR/AcrR family transcriptional regulator